jgi:hypothetical protein
MSDHRSGSEQNALRYFLKLKSFKIGSGENRLVKLGGKIGKAEKVCTPFFVLSIGKNVFDEKNF